MEGKEFENPNFNHYKFVFEKFSYYVPEQMAYSFTQEVKEYNGVSIKTSSIASMIIDASGKILKTRWDMRDIVEGKINLNITKTINIVRMHKESNTLYI